MLESSLTHAKKIIIKINTKINFLLDFDVFFAHVSDDSKKKKLIEKSNMDLGCLSSLFISAHILVPPIFQLS